MTEAFSLHRRDLREQPAPDVAGAASARAVSKPVEILAPDQYCAALLVREAAALCPAEIVPGSGRTVRLQPPPGGEWVLEVLSLVERWLASIPLPCIKVFYGDRSYLIRLPAGIGSPESNELFTTSETPTLH